MMEKQLYIDTPVGKIAIVANAEAVTRITFCGISRRTACERRRYPTPELCTPLCATPLLRQAAQEIEEYFAGQRCEFTFPAAPIGTLFQQTVWEALRTIPYGQTRSYKQIAEQAGRPNACRAVGMANNSNPLAIIIPCHRVVGSNGALVGYAGGLGVKEFLLNLEK